MIVLAGFADIFIQEFVLIGGLQDPPLGLSSLVRVIIVVKVFEEIEVLRMSVAAVAARADAELVARIVVRSYRHLNRNSKFFNLLDYVL